MSRLYRTFYRFYFHEDLIDTPLGLSARKKKETPLTETNMTSDQAFANLIEQRRKLEMIQNLEQLPSKEQRSFLNSNIVVITGMVLIFIFALVVFYTVVGWVEAPFRAGSSLVGSIADKLSSLGQGANKIQKLTPYQSAELMAVFKQQIEQLSASQMDVIKNYLVLEGDIQTLKGNLNYQSKIVESMNIDVQKQIELAVEAHRKYWESIGFYGPVKAFWISYGSKLFVSAASLAAGVGIGYSVYNFVGFIGWSLVLSDRGQAIGNRILGAFDWISWGTGVVGVFAVTGLFCGLTYSAYNLANFHYTQYLNYLKNSAELKSALDMNKLSQKEYRESINELNRQYSADEVIGISSQEVVEEKARTFWDFLIDVLW